MQEHDSDATQIKTNGWRQGSVLAEPFVEALVEKGVLPALKDTRRLIMASHDCDVTNRSFDAEPTVELLCAQVLPASNKDGNYFWGKNPRYYQLELKAADATAAIVEETVREWVTPGDELDARRRDELDARRRRRRKDRNSAQRADAAASPAGDEVVDRLRARLVSAIESWREDCPTHCPHALAAAVLRNLADQYEHKGAAGGEADETG